MCSESTSANLLRAHHRVAQNSNFLIADIVFTTTQWIQPSVQKSVIDHQQSWRLTNLRELIALATVVARMLCASATDASYADD